MPCCLGFLKPSFISAFLLVIHLLHYYYNFVYTLRKSKSGVCDHWNFTLARNGMNLSAISIHQVSFKFLEKVMMKKKVINHHLFFEFNFLMMKDYVKKLMCQELTSILKYTILTPKQKNKRKKYVIKMTKQVIIINEEFS